MHDPDAGQVLGVDCLARTVPTSGAARAGAGGGSFEHPTSTTSAATHTNTNDGSRREGVRHMGRLLGEPCNECYREASTSTSDRPCALRLQKNSGEIGMMTMSPGNDRRVTRNTRGSNGSSTYLDREAGAATTERRRSAVHNEALDRVATTRVRGS